MTSPPRYPHAKALLDRLLADRAATPALSGHAFPLGPAVLRAPPEVARPHSSKAAQGSDARAAAQSTEAMLGELVDLVFVGADEAHSGNAEVHLVFKAEVLGGLHLRLQKMPDGMHATFVVEDAAARRAVINQVDGLVAHLRGRGFSIASHRVEVAP